MASGQLAFPRAIDPREKLKPQFFFLTMILKVVFGHILISRSEAVGPSHSQGEDIRECPEYHGVGSREPS